MVLHSREAVRLESTDSWSWNTAFLGFNERAKLISASNKDIGFLEVKRMKREPGEREFLFL